MRRWQNSPRLADLLKIHFGIEVGPQDGKSSCVCTKCALKICNAGTLFEFIRTALSYKNTNEESPGKKHLKWVIIIPAQRNIKKTLCLFLTIYVVAQLPARKVCLKDKNQQRFHPFPSPKWNCNVFNSHTRPVGTTTKTSFSSSSKIRSRQPRTDEWHFLSTLSYAPMNSIVPSTN